MAKVTITDVAREAGVSVASVSFILRGVAGYSYKPETVAKVKQAAQALGYKPHAAARLLRQQQKTLIGLVIRLSVRPHANQLLIAVRDELKKRDYEPVLLEPEQLLPQYKALSFPSVDMLAGILSLDLTMEEEVPEFYLELAARLPLVALYPVADPEITSVYMDVENEVLAAAEHLAELGHRQIAFMNVLDSPHLSDKLKTSGWEKAVESLGLDSAPEYAIQVGLADSVSQMATHVVSSLEKMETRPTGLICESDEVAMSVLEKLATRGWNIPAELSVVGLDGIEFGAYSYPPLTSVAIAYEEIARLGVDVLMTQIEAEERPNPTCQLLKPALLLRRSTAAPPRSQLGRSKV